jgi:hypothetical protein
LNATLATPARCLRLCVLGGLAALFVITAGCGGSTLFRQYEYEEEMYLSLDGTATVYVNSSLAALNALRGTSFDTSPSARVDRAAVRDYYSSPNTHVLWVRESRRSNRRFVHVRLDVDDVRRLGDAAPFAWSRYQFSQDGNQYIFRQAIGAAAAKDVGKVGWTGRELVAFRLHLPSRITYHNTGSGVGRGNILVWEQSLAERLRSVPLVSAPGLLDARMDSQSILYRTLWLFAGAFCSAVAALAFLIWLTMRKGAGEASTATGP